MEKGKTYKAIVPTKEGKYIVVEGNLLAIEKEGKFYLLGKVNKSNLKKLICESTFYVTKTIVADYRDITAFKAMDRCLDYAYDIMQLVGKKSKIGEKTLPLIKDDVEEVHADNVIWISKESSGGYMYPFDLRIEQFFRCILYGCGNLLIEKYDQTIDDVWEYIENGIEAFKELNVPKDEKEKAVIATTVGFGKRVEIEGKVASVVSNGNVGIIGDTYKYNLSDLGAGTLAAIGSIYLDHFMSMDEIETYIKGMYEQAMDMIKEIAKDHY